MRQFLGWQRAGPAPFERADVGLALGRSGYSWKAPPKVIVEARRSFWRRHPFADCSKRA